MNKVNLDYFDRLNIYFTRGHFMEVLVIGGSKFSGKETVKLLAEKEHNVTVLNRGKSEKKIDAPFFKSEEHTYPRNVKVIHADRTNYTEFSEKINNNNFEAIIDTCAFNERDIQAILNLTLEKLEHYVFVSTGSVYDEEKITMIPITEEAPFGSEADDDPVPYSRDKRRAETLLHRAFKENNFPITIFRPTYIYGSYNPIYREMYFFDRINDQKTVYMPGNGEYILDFVFTKDIAWLLSSPLENKKAIGKAYNAAGEGGITLNNYVKLLETIIGKKVNVVHFDPQIVIKQKLEPENRNQMFPFSYDMHFLMSKEKAVVDLGYNPTSLFDGLKETFNWYQKYKNPKWEGDYAFDEKIAELLRK